MPGKGQLFEKGYRQGGPAGFGLRRTLIDGVGTVKGLLARGEHKSIQTDRVILTPELEGEVAVVQEVYRGFVHHGRSEREIADDLNSRVIFTDLGRAWTCITVHQLLINEKYLANNVLNRRSFNLKKKRVCNVPDMWICAPGVFKGIIERDLWDAVQSKIHARSLRLSDDDLLKALQFLCSRKGLLSGIMIDECDGIPSSRADRRPIGHLAPCRR